MKITNFKDLEIWRISLGITKDIYDYTAKIRFSKDYGLRDQIRRAVISISSNIVEGFEKNNSNEFIRYLRISIGSVGEARNQLEIAKAVGYITDEELRVVDDKLLNLSKQIGGFIRYLDQHRKNRKKYMDS